MTFFASAYKALAHLAPNWDTQLRTDMGFLEGMLDQAAWTPGYGGTGGGTIGNNGGSDGYSVTLGKHVTYHGRIIFGSSATFGGGVLTNFGIGGTPDARYSFGHGWYKSAANGDHPIMLMASANGTELLARIPTTGGAFATLSTIASAPTISDEIRFVVDVLNV